MKLFEFLDIKTCPNEEIDEKEDVESEINLLGGALLPRCTALNLKVLTENQIHKNGIKKETYKLAS